MARASKTRNAVEWLENNPDKTVNQAAAKFKVAKGGIYSARRKNEIGKDLMNSPMVIPMNHSTIDSKPGQSVIIIVKTDNPAELLRSLFQ